MPVLQVVRWILLAAEIMLALPLLYLGLISVSALLRGVQGEKRPQGPTRGRWLCGLRFCCVDSGA